jgi:hypothetical protein
MRVYLELFEVLPEGSTEEPDFIRIDVTGWRQDDIVDAVSLLREQAAQYDSFILQRHFCFHDEGKECYAESI